MALALQVLLSLVAALHAPAHAPREAPFTLTWEPTAQGLRLVVATQWADAGTLTLTPQVGPAFATFSPRARTIARWTVPAGTTAVTAQWRDPRGRAGARAVLATPETAPARATPRAFTPMPAVHLGGLLIDQAVPLP